MGIKYSRGICSWNGNRMMGNRLREWEGGGGGGGKRTSVESTIHGLSYYCSCITINLNLTY